MLQAFAQTTQNPPVPQTPPPGTFESLVALLTSPSATAFAWFATVASFILAIIPLLLYVKEKRSNQAMQQLVTEFQLAERVREGLARTQAEKKQMEKESEKLFEEIRSCPAPGSEDTELGVLMEPEVGHGEATVYT